MKKALDVLEATLRMYEQMLTSCEMQERNLNFALQQQREVVKAHEVNIINIAKQVKLIKLEERSGIIRLN
jgi:hypothetical protein